MTSTDLLTADAKNRALRTFIQGLAIDLAVAVGTVLVTVFATAGGWGDIQWAVVGFSLAKTVVQTVVSYVMRRKIDGSVIPTPLPPTPQPEPAEPVGGPAL